jgi:deoxyribodipyrimidine photo-lyase
VHDAIKKSDKAMLMATSRLDEPLLHARGGVHVVWLKRDLRTTDHAPLAFASQQERAIAIYVFENEVLQQPETDASHVVFILQSLEEIRKELRASGMPLVVMRGEIEWCLDEIARWAKAHGGVASLLSHEETGTMVTYRRDVRVARWCSKQKVPWKQWPTTGVVRGLVTRDGWAKRWLERMSRPVLMMKDPKVHVIDASGLGLTRLPSVQELGLNESTKTLAQAGGQAAAARILESFLYARGATYRRDISSPQTAWFGSSRMSPHLAYGTMSTRQVVHAMWQREEEIKTPGEGLDPTIRKAWLASLRSFESRLRWRDHFMQKLEDEPAIEFDNMSRAYDGLRIEAPSQWGELEHRRFDAWCQGRTGYPMVDACMRCLLATGWINFRMRAMLSSFNAYHLWLHWRPAAVYLAKHFLDFEPGIHYSQFQMQSGTTGINTIRMYNPMKQAQEHDPTGEFIRRWVPELRDTPLDVIHALGGETDEGTTLFGSNLELGVGSDGYPAPIVSHRQAYSNARDRIYAIRKTGVARSEAQRVYNKHGSRKGSTREGWRVKFKDDRGGAIEQAD